MTILVTGGCGFIASNFINSVSNHYDIVNLDKLDVCSSVDKCVVKPVVGNVHNRELLVHLIEKHKFDVVIHFAAHSHVDNSFEDPVTFTEENTIGTHILIDTFRQHSPNTEIIHFSTDEVYGESLNDKQFLETDTLSPTNPYAASKAAAEMIVMSYIKSFNMNIKIIRCNNVYGPNQYHEKLIPKFIKLIKEGKKCTLHGTNSANLKRAFIHVDDVTSAVLNVWKYGTPGEIYNISSDYEVSVLDVAKIIIEESTGTNDYDKWLTNIPDRPFNDERYYINSDKLRKLGWKQQKNLDDLREFIRLEVNK
jgi:dTDP-glucose 4,6-dehydratase